MNGMGPKSGAGDLRSDLRERVVAGGILRGGVSTPFAPPVASVLSWSPSAIRWTNPLFPSMALPPSRVHRKVLLIGHFAHDIRSWRPPSCHPEYAACHNRVPFGPLVYPCPVLTHVHHGNPHGLPRGPPFLSVIAPGFPSFGRCPLLPLPALSCCVSPTAPPHTLCSTPGGARESARREVVHFPKCITIRQESTFASCQQKPL